MSAAQWKARIRRIKDPVKLLAEVRGFPGTLGDPYYRDMEEVLFEQIDKVLESHGKKR